MIFITQGHEKSIGLEVFLKSFLMLSTKEQSLFTLCTNINSFLDTTNSLNIDVTIDGETLIIAGSKLKIAPIGADSNLPQSTDSLTLALDKLTSDKDILLTLPTSKDQLIYKDKMAAGYTEFLRKRFSTPNVSMLFSSPTDNALLITDHIPLKDVPTVISKDLILNKVANVLNNIGTYFENYEEVLFAGLNPHVGENGILGDEDKVIFEAVDELQKTYPQIKLKGPYSGDTLHFHENEKKQLLVYMYHDQGLPWFKGKNKVVGLNISLGLPFLRMSVDHGTAFDLYGKGQANYLGCHYLLRSAIQAQNKLLGKT